MSVVITVLVTLLVVGVLWEPLESEFFPGRPPPNPLGCIAGAIGSAGLIVLGLMQLGAWLWGGG